MLSINSSYMIGKTKGPKQAPGVLVPFQKAEKLGTPRERHIEMRLRYNSSLKMSQTYDIVVIKFDKGLIK